MKCTHPDGHTTDNQGYCFNCGIPMLYADCSQFWVVFNDDDGKLYIRQTPFSTLTEAQKYLKGIAKSRKPRIMIDLNN